METPGQGNIAEWSCPLPRESSCYTYINTLQLTHKNKSNFLSFLQTKTMKNDMISHVSFVNKHVFLWSPNNGLKKIPPNMMWTNLTE